MLIETQVLRSKSEPLKELQATSVTKAVIYRNVDKKGWDAIAKEHQTSNLVIVIR